MANSDLAVPRRYKRPPIVEADFEIRFQEALSSREMERLRDRYKRNHPAVEEQHKIQIDLQRKKAVATVPTLSGYKLTASNANDVVLIQQNILGSSRLAPYEGWDRFIEKARQNFEIFSKISGHR